MKTTKISLIALLAGWGSHAAGNTILDQQEQNFGSVGFIQGNMSLAQTFTPSVSGELAHLDLFIGNDYPPEGKPLFVSMYNTKNDVPNNLLGTLSIYDPNQNLSWHSFDFSTFNIFLQANTLYAYVLSSPGTYFGYAPGGDSGDSYPGGIVGAIYQNS